MSITKFVPDIKLWVKNHRFSPSVKLKYSFYGEHELALSSIIAHWLIKELGGKSFSKNTVQDLVWLRVKEHPEEKLLWHYVEFVVDKWNLLYDREPLNMSPEKLSEALRKDVIGSLLQDLLPPKERKMLAANYTSLQDAEILVSYLPDLKYETVLDPFCGSGRLITAFLNSEKSRYLKHIYINDIMPSAVLLAYARAKLFLKERERPDVKIHVTIGDAFNVFSQNPFGFTTQSPVLPLDLVIMNPPFTRIQSFYDEQLNHLKWLENYYPNIFSGQSGLHVYSLYLAHMLLKEDGILAAILPSATFMSNYSVNLQKFLLTQFEDVLLATPVDKISLTEDSLLRELLLLGRKIHSSTNFQTRLSTVKFIRLTPQLEKNKTTPLFVEVNRNELFKEWNWTKYFHPPKLREWAELILSTGKIHSGDSLGFSLVRGVEMYGPNFFFIPNKYCEILEEKEDYLKIKMNDNKLKKEVLLPKMFLSKIMRRAGNYPGLISPTVKDYALVVPPEYSAFSEGISEYVSALEQETRLAKKRFGEKWISHIHKQLLRKNPYGHVFVADKLPLLSVSRIAFYLDEPLACTKNFFVFNNVKDTNAKLLAAWMNSSLFLLLFLNVRREIGGSYGRLAISDYKKETLFINYNNTQEKQVKRILEKFDLFRRRILPPIKNQVFYKPKMFLDLEFIYYLGLDAKNDPEALLTDIHLTLREIFKEFEKRDKTRTKREG